MARKRAKFIILDEMRKIELEIIRAENLMAGISTEKEINEIRLEKLRKELKDIESPR